MKLLRYLLIGVIVIGGGFAIYLLGIKSDSKPKPKLAATTTAAGTSSSGPARTSPNDTWTVRPGPVSDTFVGYRVRELLLRGNIDQEVTGRTNQVTGQFLVANGIAATGELAAQVDTLSTNSGLRDSAVKRTGLESSKFPTATFTLTQPIELGSAKAGQRVKTNATGNLTVHGVTKPVRFALDTRWDGNTIEIAGSAPIKLSDFGIRIDDFKFAAEVANDATIELQLTFVPK